MAHEYFQLYITWLYMAPNSIAEYANFPGKACFNTPVLAYLPYVVVPIHMPCHPCYSIYGHIFSDLGYAAVWLLAIPIHSYHDYYDAHQLQIWNKGDPILALFPSHSQILSHSCG